MADNTTELEVLDEIVDVLGGQSGQYETVVPTLQQIKELLASGVVDPEAIAAAVAAWLDEHPEATTTVQDGSITGVKIADDTITDAKLAHSSVVKPINWCDHDALTSGILNADGTVTEASNRVYTGFVPVTSGDVVRTYYRTNGMYMTNVCAYDADKQVISGEGRDSSGMTFTVGANTKFVRVTFDSNYIAKAMLTVNLVPTAYEDYFAPYYVLTKDYLTPQSQDVISGLIDKTLTSANLANRYGCALPRTELRQTVGLSQSWYLRNMATPATEYVYVGAGSLLTLGDGSFVTFPNAQASSSANGFKWERYDAAMATIDSGLGPAGYGYECKVATENLSNCTMLVIGDSTVDQDVMTQALLTHFTAQEHTLTLLGTLGSGDNKNEGRAGWSARDYLTNRKYEGVTNPFYNPTSETFDFAYYMTNQGYAAPDFVVVQLGINDLYSADETAIQPTWNAVKTIIDSIVAYDPAIKVILNLVTPPNSSQEVHSAVGNRLFMYHNRVVRYNDLATRQVLASYQSSRVRTSYCHLILDPATDIRDHVHPTNAGYEKMALEIVNQVNCWLN